MPISSSLLDLLHRLFPSTGRDKELPYAAFPAASGEMPASYQSPPLLPPDLFAAVGYLIELSGAYHHVVPEVPSRLAREVRKIVISADDIRQARAVARAWRAFDPEKHFSADKPAAFHAWLSGEGKPLATLFDWWKAVFETSADVPVYKVLSPVAQHPDWWRPAVMMLIAADEAFSQCGYQLAGPAGDQGPAILLLTQYRMARLLEAHVTAAGSGAGSSLAEGIASISSASQDVVAVVPKARTAAVGCTMRSLSHHLALLPPRGVAKASWIPFLSGDLAADTQQMNLLLIPFPFSIPARAFKERSRFEGRGVRWGFFEIEQTWLQDITENRLLEFIEALACEAEKECGHIHGVVFPEMALNQQLYSAVFRLLPSKLPGIEIFVAGQSGESGPGMRPGNFVSMAVYHERQGDDRRSFFTRREKHHRWKIDRNQLIDYGLEGILSPSMSWWEDIDLLSRRVDFAVVRKGSVFTALICEDLARIDPCQELLRAVGPNVVFALLMDAPQYRARWPGRYATVLAEDPGTAVLTFTSRALMTRQHRLGKHRSKCDDDRVVALWREGLDEPREITCPNWAHGVCLTLSGVNHVDATLEGRDDPEAVSWRYASHRALRVEDVVNRFRDILGTDDEALQGELNRA